MSDFDRAVTILLEEEGGYVNNPKDPGGETNFGISKSSYPNVDIAHLTPDGVKAIYFRDYWTPAHCEQMPWPLSLFVLDCAVNCGIGTAIKLLQGSLNVNADGVFGPHTADAIGNHPLEQTLEKFQVAHTIHYFGFKGFDVFGKGWCARVARVCLKAFRDYKIQNPRAQDCSGTSPG